MAMERRVACGKWQMTRAGQKGKSTKATELTETVTYLFPSFPSVENDFAVFMLIYG
jgi:hypothetical protein